MLLYTSALHHDFYDWAEFKFSICLAPLFYHLMGQRGSWYWFIKLQTDRNKLIYRIKTAMTLFDQILAGLNLSIRIFFRVQVQVVWAGHIIR